MKPTLILLISTVLFTACAHTPEAKPKSDFKRDPNSVRRDVRAEESLSAEEMKFLQLVNALRRSKGLPGFEVAADLQRAAYKHSVYMDARHRDHSADESDIHEEGDDPNALVYTSGGRIELEGGDYMKWAENVACGSESAEGVYRQWFNSPGHYKHMVSPKYQFIGISRVGTHSVKRASRGSDIACPYFWTTDFGGN